VIDEIVKDVTKEENPAQPMERVLVNSLESYEKDDEAEVDECVR